MSSVKYFKPGDIIYEDDAFAHVLFTKYRGQRCDYCFKRSPELKTCRSCNETHYCGKVCQKKDWPQHRHECPRLGYLFFDPFEHLRLDGELDRLRFVGRVMFLLKGRSWDSCSSQVGGVHFTFRDLVSHWDDIKKDEETMSAFVAQLFQLNQYLGRDFLTRHFTSDQIFEILGKLKHNSFEGDAGYLLYIGASIFDHACIPVAYRALTNNGYGRRMRIRALTNNIPADVDIRQVTVLYSSIDEFHELPRSFYGPCKCADCVLPSDESKLRKVLNGTLSKNVIEYAEVVLRRCRELKNLGGEEEIIRKLIPNVRKALAKMKDVLGETHLLRLRLLQFLVLNTGKEEDNKENFKRLVELFETTFGKYNLSLAVFFTTFHKEITAGRTAWSFLSEETYMKQFAELHRVLDGEGPYLDVFNEYIQKFFP